MIVVRREEEDEKGDLHSNAQSVCIPSCERPGTAQYRLNIATS
jgi:hypothetical protein